MTKQSEKVTINIARARDTIKERLGFHPIGCTAAISTGWQNNQEFVYICPLLDQCHRQQRIDPDAELACEVDDTFLGIDFWSHPNLDSYQEQYGYKPKPEYDIERDGEWGGLTMPEGLAHRKYWAKKKANRRKEGE